MITREVRNGHVYLHEIEDRRIVAGAHWIPLAQQWAVTLRDGRTITEVCEAEAVALETMRTGRSAMERVIEAMEGGVNRDPD